MNSMKSQKDRTLKDELPNMLLEISGEITPERMKGWSQSKNNYPVVYVTGERSKVWCCKEQYCIGTWKVRSMNQGKLEVVKQEMVLGASMGDPTHDKVMRRGLMGKVSQASGVPPGFSWTSTPQNQSLPALLYCAFHSSDILWKKVNSGLQSPAYERNVSAQTPLMAL